MAKQDYEQISALMDGEQPLDEALLGRLEKDAATAGRWRRYHLARTAMRDGHAALGATDMVQRVHAQLADEPVVLAPHHRRHQRPAWLRQAAGMAIAATVAVVAVLAVQPSRLGTPEADGALATAPSASPRLAAVQPASTERLSRAAEARLSAYLVNHNEIASMAGMQGIPAYTRIISSTPGERIGD